MRRGSSTARWLTSFAFAALTAARVFGTDASAPTPAATLNPGNGLPYAIFYSSSAALVTVDQTRKVSIWDASSGDPLRTVPSPFTAKTSTAGFAAFLDGKRLALASAREGTEVVDLEAGKAIATLPFVPQGAFAVAPEGTRLFAVDAATTRLCEIDLTSGKTIVASTATQASRLFSAAWSPDGLKIAAMWDRARGIVWLDAVTLRETAVSMPATSAVQMAYSPDGARVFASVQQEDSRSVIAIDARNGKKIWSAPMFQNSSRFSLSADGTRMANLSGAVPSVVIRETTNGRIVATSRKVDTHESLVLDFALSSDGTRVAVDASLKNVEPGAAKRVVEIYSLPGPKKPD